MKMALSLAEKGRGYTSPNPMVGAVVVRDGKVVGKGWHKVVGGAHAEVNALDDARSLAKDATLYVTLEPCHHEGRTPPCTKKILNSGVKRVVVAMDDPNPDVRGGGNAFLKENGIEVISGICEAEAKKQNEIFIKFVSSKQPFVILKCAATLDGRLATRTGDSKWISGPKSRTFVHEIRHMVDGILVGINTVQNDDPSLTTRLENIQGRDPIRIILDTHLSIDEHARVFQLDSEAETLIITGSTPPEEKKARLSALGAKVIETVGKNGRIDLNALMNELGKRDISSLLIEGGGSVIASAFKSGIVDKVHFFYGPKILGGDDGIPMCSGPGPELMKNSLPVKEIRVRRFDDDVMIEGYVN